MIDCLKLTTIKASGAPGLSSILLRSLEQIGNLTTDELAVEVGQKMELACQTVFRPPSTISWTRLEGEMPRDVLAKGSKLVVDVVRPEHAGTYSCSVNGKPVSQTVVLVTGLIPYFGQAPLSYIEFDTMPDAYLSFKIKLSFKPDANTGLILYSGQPERSQDFLSLSLKDGFVEFRFVWSGLNRESVCNFFYLGLIAEGGLQLFALPTG